MIKVSNLLAKLPLTPKKEKSDKSQIFVSKLLSFKRAKLETIHVI